MIFVDAFVAAVPTDQKERYRAHAETVDTVFIEHGALRITECWGEDVPDGDLTSFPKAVQRQDNETVVFGWVEWPDRQTRDDAMPKVMSDPRMQPDLNPMPFDGKRMIYGGFQSIVSL